MMDKNFGLQIQRFSLSKQIELFQGTQEMIKMKIGEAAATKFFKEARYVVAMGSNDYINNFLLPVYADSWTYNGETFTNYVITTLDAQLRVSSKLKQIWQNNSDFFIYIVQILQLLYSLGARQLTFFGLGPMGCIPLQRFMTLSGDCQESTNKLSLMFNNKSMTLLENLSKTLPNATYQFGDAYNIFQDLINRPEIYGLWIIILYVYDQIMKE